MKISLHMQILFTI